MTSTFLLEIGTEELPADFARLALTQLRERVLCDLDESRLEHQGVFTTGTPRRLVVRVDGLQDQQADLREERRGPPAAQAFLDGTPAAAAIGFAKRCNVDPATLEVRDTPKGPCVFATVLTPGQPSQTLLQDLIPRWIAALQGRRFMRWGSGSQRFSRPIRWLLALQGADVIPVDLPDGDPVVRSDRFSRGHRLHGETPLEISDADRFSAALSAAGVVVDRSERAAMIRAAIDRNANALQGEPNCPEHLFEELVDLVEAPQMLRGRIADRFLQLPPEVISTVMQSHQRYVPLDIPSIDPDPLRLTSQAVLRPDFLIVGNGLEQSADLIIRGNERVLGARLADAEFFLDVDRRQSSTSRRSALDRVTFAEGLGSLQDRSDRIEQVTATLLEALDLPEETRRSASRAAHLCKNDLVSQMVGEFPELQGLMGGKYLLEEGEPRAVALAVVEHYLPRGAGDALPQTEAGAVVALAERFELLLSIYAKGLRPSGSSDPYALRRAGNGILQILWNRCWRLDLITVLSQACQQWSEKFPAFGVDPEALAQDLKQLLRQRIASQLEDDGYDVDLIASVAGESVTDEQLLRDPVDGRQRILLLSALRRSGELAMVQAVVQRAGRLAEKGDLPVSCLSPEGVIDKALFDSPSEQQLFDQVVALEAVSGARNYPALVESLRDATPVLESFFDGENSVMVMSEDLDVRKNRLNLLSVFRNQALVLADFSVMQSR